jgi:tryptophan synthase beta chain
MLYPNVEELRKILKITAEPSFQAEFDSLLRRICRTPYSSVFCRALVKEYNTKVYLKEKTYATLAHKINNTIGQILLAKRLGKTRIIAETG